MPIKRKTSKLAPIRAKSADRKLAILKARAEGKTFRELAEDFGLSQRRVRELVAEEFARLTTERNEIAQDALQRLLKRLDDLLVVHWDEALEGDLEAGKMALAIMDKQSRLLGVAQPKEQAPPGNVNVFVGIAERAAMLGYTVEQLRGPLPPVALPAPEVIDVEVTER